jgi:hypothetical protein
VGSLAIEIVEDWEVELFDDDSDQWCLKIENKHNLLQLNLLEHQKLTVLIDYLEKTDKEWCSEVLCNFCGGVIQAWYYKYQFAFKIMNEGDVNDNSLVLIYLTAEHRTSLACVLRLIYKEAMTFYDNVLR